MAQAILWRATTRRKDASRTAGSSTWHADQRSGKLRSNRTRRGVEGASLIFRSRRETMAIAKVSEIIASSSKSFEDAIQHGIQRANKTLEQVKGAWVKDQKVVVENG